MNLRKRIVLYVLGMALLTMSTGVHAFSTYNVIFITGLDATPNPFDPAAGPSNLTVNTLEYAEWFWLVPSTMARPTVIVNVAGRPLIATMISESLGPLGFFGFPPIFFWFNQIGWWTHQTTWDGRNLAGQLAPGPHLATINVYAGAATTFGAFTWEVAQSATLNLTVTPEIAPEGTATVSVLAIDVQGNPLPNYAVRLEATAPQYTAEPCNDCGGHSHDGTRPVGNFVSAVNVVLGGTTEGATGPAGEAFTLRYKIDAFGGRDKIKATAINQPAVTTEQSITVRVPNLSWLPDSPDYVKIGGTAGHRGPPNFSPPDNNHYGTATRAIQDIQQLARDYHRRFSERLMINDMSLPFGGGFDVSGGWRTDIDQPGCRSRGHCTHRLGTDVDVADRTAGGARVDPAWLRGAVRNLGGRFLQERTHFHLTFP
jgi:hypothetical protein